MKKPLADKHAGNGGGGKPAPAAPETANDSEPVQQPGETPGAFLLRKLKWRETHPLKDEPPAPERIDLGPLDRESADVLAGYIAKKFKESPKGKWSIICPNSHNDFGSGRATYMQPSEDNDWQGSMKCTSQSCTAGPQDLFRWMVQQDDAPWPECEPITGYAGNSDCDAALLALAGKDTTARREIEDKVKNLKVPVSMAAMSTFVSLAALMQSLYLVEHPATMEKIRTSMYAMPVAESGERKSAVDAVSFRAMDEWEEHEREAHANLIVRRKRELALWKDEEKRLRNAVTIAQIANDAAAVEKASNAYAALRPEPTLPKYHKFRTGDTSKEALLESYGSRPGRMISSGEAGVVFGGYALQKDNATGMLAVLNDLWQGKLDNPDRITRETHNRTEGDLSQWLQVQPDVLRDFMRAQGNRMKAMGALARYCMTWPVSTQGYRLLEPERMKSLDWKGRDAHQLALGALTLRLLAGEEHGLLKVSDEAWPVWHGFFNDTEMQLRPMGALADAKAATSKVGEHALRLAAYAWCIDSLGNPEAMAAEVKPQIGRGQMERGCAAALALLHSQIVTLAALESEGDLADARKLEAWVIEKGGAVSRHAASNGGPLRKAERLNPAVDVLVGLGRMRDIEGRGLEVHPALRTNAGTS